MLDAFGDTYIGTVRAHTAERDALALQVRLRRVLASLSLRPSGVPASAVVCVRRLRAPPLGHAASLGGAPRAAAWDNAVESSLARLVERAARPARGFVPADADAVVFFDRAELLACLASDWLAGAAARRWWWRGILRGRDTARALLAAWLDAPEYVPTALELLAREGRAASFVASLEDASARELSQRVARAFALGELGDALAGATRTSDGDGRDRSTTRDEDAEQRFLHQPAAHAAAPPWETHFDGARDDALGTEQQCLLGLGLTLALAPSHARAPSFVRAVRAWRDDARRAPSDARATHPARESASAESAKDDVDARVSPSPAPLADAGRDSLSTRPAAETRGVEAERVRRVEEARDEARGAGEEAREAREFDDDRLTARGDDAGARDAAAVESRADVATHDEERAPVEQAATPRFDAPKVDARGDARQVDAADETQVDEEWQVRVVPRLVEARAETKLGGLFYLVNVGLFLELYGDFTTPLEPGIALNVWDFVALLGRRLCADDARDDESDADENKADGGDAVEGEDAVWSLLARLAGRGEGEEPGRGFDAPQEWRVPPKWLAPFPEVGVWEWSARGGRLRVRHPRGFYVVDVRRRRAVSEARQLRDELAAYDGLANFRLRRVKRTKDEAVADAVVVGRLERWTDWLAAYVRARLARALGRESRAESSRLVLEQEASVRVTATHVDAYFQLARLPIEVRLAGLDRDPGWVPAAGRFVAFHYD
ncbi:MAG TPA: hypothetical protein VFX96_06600 [Pyrinomonadaceae bacterium]|nr:hypothetical protein [Pyrinomonadaceae bacterium]